ncbi:hypothetical protein GCM10010172_07070 [Paractinoplanes ferrugineus]|uniref:Uncharacterized protein n=1 Tax=Paractinoplanes ferrugineus TaxID=113564 RepID=A0A919J9J8_9ACTN|nr:hypothetical protein [Actinoplanes ferrugineus]GIE16265.1 hypothetical protein Afe05nite_81050 [Actinoplanes ferrugineus]
MDHATSSWKLERFPALASCRSGIPIPDEVQKAYTSWLETRKIHPKRGALRLQEDDIRYSARIPGGDFAHEGCGWQLMCDFDVIEGNWATGSPGEVVFTDMGVIQADSVRE